MTPFKIQSEICDICMHQNNYDVEIRQQLKEKFGRDYPITHKNQSQEMSSEFYKMREVPCATLDGVVAICKKHVQEMMEVFG